MLVDIGLKWCVIGHSERRNDIGGSLGGDNCEKPEVRI
jgi:triosephosphate isomerase